MPVDSPRIPTYRLHKPTGQAVVRLQGRDIYLGKHGTESSRERYRRTIAEWLSTGTPPVLARERKDAPSPEFDGLTVAELILRFLRHAETHYRHADGSPTGTARNFKDAIRPLRRLYGRTPAAKFGPKSLRALREEMTREGLSRTTINFRVGKIVQMFRWAVGEELIPPSVHQAIAAVPGLQKVRSEARELDPVKPVPEAHVEAVLPYVKRQVWTMIELQRLAGMRPGEVIRIRSIDLDTSGRIWLYRPSHHKSEHVGKDRIVYLGPKAQAILRSWLRAELEAPLFSPVEAMEEFRARQRADRKTKVQPSQRDRSKSTPRCRPRIAYSVQTYAYAVARACDRAGVPRWRPNRLRHNAATRLRHQDHRDLCRARSRFGHAGHEGDRLNRLQANLETRTT